jgi:preprotein translocase subunit SecA
MGLWNWLTGKSRCVAVADRIWLTGVGKRQALGNDMRQHVANNRPVLVLAHFPATLTEVRSELASNDILPTTFSKTISATEIDKLVESPGTGEATKPTVQLGLVKQLDPNPFPCPGMAEGNELQIAVAERHFLPGNDQTIIGFARSLSVRCQVTFYLSLDDPLLKTFVAQPLIELLQKLGMTDATPIESALITRRLRSTQKQFARRMDLCGEFNSAEEWLEQWQIGTKK